jgi:hypothetical protein
VAISVRKHSGDPDVSDWMGAGITDFIKYGKLRCQAVQVFGEFDRQVTQFDRKGRTGSGVLVGVISVEPLAAFC